MGAVLKWGIFTGVGAIILALGLGVGYGVLPGMIEGLINDNLNLWDTVTPSEGRKNFEKLPIDLYMKFYFYHVTNPDKVIMGEKPIVEEKGPYSYLEKRLKVDIHREGDFNHIYFGQKKTYIFDADTSCSGCTKDDNVTVINAPLVGFQYQLSAQAPNLDKYAGDVNKGITKGEYKGFIDGHYQTVTNEEWKDSLFMTVPVDGLIFNGVKPGVLKLAFETPLNTTMGSLYPKKLIKYPQGFAALNNRNDTSYYEYYQMNTGYSDMEKYYQLEKWGPTADELFDDLSPAQWWTRNGAFNGSNVCNFLNGTDGQQFHTDITEDDKLYLFATDICRSIFATYQKDVEIDGIATKRFKVPSEAFQLNTTDNIGYCMEYNKHVPWNDCIVPQDNSNELDLTNCNMTEYKVECYDGILDITKCMGDAPVVVSSPHFYQGPSELHEAIEGMTPPEPEKHETIFDIEPHLGMAIRIHKRLQFNTILKPYDKFDTMANVQPMIFPIFWLDEGAEIDQENIDKLKEMLITPLKVAEIGKWVVVALGSVMLLVGVGFMVKAGMTRSKNGRRTKSMKL